jgi:response regulator RpfG family c-di-GMP phosphodiesterase
MTEVATNTEAPRPVILCVDDEPAILSALRRLFRSHGFAVLTAEGGQAGLALLDIEHVDLVISDMRMPVMDGVVFLEHVRQKKPALLRLLLTGYADMASVIGAINRGEIYRYIAKPWDDNDIILTVRDALGHSALLEEKGRLQALVHAQNEELKGVNASLEQKVEARTTELRQSNLALQGANGRLKNNFLTSIKLFTALIELRDNRLAGHSRRVADSARRVAHALALDNKQVQEVFVAGLLHGIGMVGFDDQLLHTPVASMNARQLEIYRKHPARAEQLLMPLAELKSTLEIISAQQERFDGSGYPQGSAGRHIPMGARILAVASDYDSLQIGLLEPQRLSAAQAQELLRKRSGHSYDPAVVEKFLEICRDLPQGDMPASSPSTRTVQSAELTSGMVLARDLCSPTGTLLLVSGHLLDDAVISKIIAFEHATDARLTALIWVGAPPAEA